jgi:hypothetical protein
MRQGMRGRPCFRRRQACAPAPHLTLVSSGAALFPVQTVFKMAYHRLAPVGLVTEVWEIERLSDYVSLVEDRCDGDLYYFRGQRADFPLRPKMARLRMREGYERRAIEQDMVRAFGNAAQSYLAHVPDNPWDVIALAQHHGMATRLLDWSKNPLTSLWFAVERPPTDDRSPGVVWVLSPDYDDLIQTPAGSPFEINALRIWEPRHVSPRIRAQAAAFTVHPMSKESGEFVSLQEIPDAARKLMKISFPAREFARLRYDLDRCGINAASVYADVDGLARHVEWSHSYGADEGPFSPRPPDPVHRPSEPIDWGHDPAA